MKSPASYANGSPVADGSCSQAVVAVLLPVIRISTASRPSSLTQANATVPSPEYGCHPCQPSGTSPEAGAITAPPVPAIGTAVTG